MYLSSKIIEQTQVTADTFLMTMFAPEIASTSQPGQFVMVKGWENQEPFLMRPISINRIDTETFSLLYKIKGRGTKLMSEMKAGDSMQVLGPLGHGFPILQDIKNVAVIGRGIGIAPLRPLVERYVSMGVKVYAYLSAKLESDLFDKDFYESIGVTVRTSTSAQEKVTDYFIEDCKNIKIDVAYSCGSKRLAADMQSMHREYGFPAYISLEEHMACGVGACKGCICTTYEKETGEENYARVCKSGPVFEIDRVMK